MRLEMLCLSESGMTCFQRYNRRLNTHYNFKKNKCLILHIYRYILRIKSQVKYPLLFPETLPEEDAIRAKGHVTLSRG